MLKPAAITYFSLLSALMPFFFWQPAAGAQTQILQNEEIVVVYDPPLEYAAGDVVRTFPVLKKELEEILAWRLDTRPQVVLVRSRTTFQDIARNNLIVAFAVPDRDLIVIDYSRMSTHPFNLGITLKHELCHLLLHEHIPSGNLPKWFDEGVCQWASDGIGEIYIDKGWSGLDAAVMAGQTYRLSRLTTRFPEGRSALMLAYEQSKSVVAYIDRQYGKQQILTILNDLRNGETIEAAIAQNLNLDLNQLEEEWLQHLESTPRWLVFLANNIYGIIFLLAAVLTVFGFVRLLMRKKAYREWDDEEDDD